MKNKNFNFNAFQNFVNYCKQNKFGLNTSLGDTLADQIEVYKKGNKIHIKKENRGKFTKYCNGNVTSECIQRGKNSSDPKIRKMATFAANSRRWKHENGGTITLFNNRFNNYNSLSQEDYVLQ